MERLRWIKLCTVENSFLLEGNEKQRIDYQTNTKSGQLCGNIPNAGEKDDGEEKTSNGDRDTNVGYYLKWPLINLCKTRRNV